MNTFSLMAQASFPVVTHELTKAMLPLLPQVRENALFPVEVCVCAHVASQTGPQVDSLVSAQVKEKVK